MHLCGLLLRTLRPCSGAIQQLADGEYPTDVQFTGFGGSGECLFLTYLRAGIRHFYSNLATANLAEASHESQSSTICAALIGSLVAKLKGRGGGMVE